MLRISNMRLLPYWKVMLEEYMKERRAGSRRRAGERTVSAMENRKRPGLTTAIFIGGFALGPLRASFFIMLFLREISGINC